MLQLPDGKRACRFSLISGLAIEPIAQAPPLAVSRPSLDCFGCLKSPRQESNSAMWLPVSEVLCFLFEKLPPKVTPFSSCGIRRQYCALDVTVSFVLRFGVSALK